MPPTILLPTDTEPGPAVMFIGELDGFAINQGPTWVAQAAVTVLNSEEQPVSGTVVSGNWSEGDTETTSCTTDEAGTCELVSDSIRKRVPKIVFEITDLQNESLAYLAGLDDVDSPEDQPRTITIRKP